MHFRARYSEMFARLPELSVQKLQSFAAGDYIVQLEEVTGREPAPERHVAVYRLTAGLISHELLLR